jgi:hypothetical protein
MLADIEAATKQYPRKGSRERAIDNIAIIVHLSRANQLPIYPQPMEVISDLLPISGQG